MKEFEQFSLYDKNVTTTASNKTQLVPSTTKTDTIVESVVEKYKQRSQVGVEKYGTTLHENNHDDFLKHLQEELMDATLYIEKLMKQIELLKNNQK